MEVNKALLLPRGQVRFHSFKGKKGFERLGKTKGSRGSFSFVEQLFRHKRESVRCAAAG